MEYTRSLCAFGFRRSIVHVTSWFLRDGVSSLTEQACDALLCHGELCLYDVFSLTVGLRIFMPG